MTGCDFNYQLQLWKLSSTIVTRCLCAEDNCVSFKQKAKPWWLGYKQNDWFYIDLGAVRNQTWQEQLLQWFPICTTLLETKVVFLH